MKNPHLKRMREKPLKIWAVIIGTRGRHTRYISGHPRPKAFFTRAEARAYKYNEGDFKDMHVVQFEEKE